MEEQFNHHIAELFDKKKIICIPVQTKYDEMITTIQKSSEQKQQRLSNDEANLIRRYSSSHFPASTR
jgi:hypothetical protein